MAAIILICLEISGEQKSFTFKYIITKIPFTFVIFLYVLNGSLIYLSIIIVIFLPASLPSFS